ncbi:MAG TPA: metallophosphoesterase [Thermoanaerobaculia bacterium]|jgi:predicted phosphodiesterase
MRVFALSDIHIDYDANAKWVGNLSLSEYQDDVLILAGDVTDTLRLLDWCLREFARRFKQVLFVPGNHDLWVIRDDRGKNSLQKFEEVCAAVESSGASMQPFRARGVSILPLLSWYDYSFGEPTAELRAMWMDFRACRWPSALKERDIAPHFAALNETRVSPPADKIITYSHFLPRIDVMPAFISCAGKMLYPILGSDLLDRQVRSLNADIHVYGHSHVNRHVTIDGVTYINNAFGYPSETMIAAKRLKCIYEC